jgi:N utilization substance protein B
MFSRRQIREKTLQSIYSYQLSDIHSLDIGESNLIQSFQKAHDCYVLLLAIIVDVCRYNIEFADEMDARPRAMQQGIKENRRIGTHPFVEALSNSAGFVSAIKALKGAANFEKSLIRNIFLHWHKTQEYQTFCALDTVDPKTEKDILIHLLINVLYENEQVNSHFDEFNLSWSVDDVADYEAVLETIHLYYKGKLKVIGITKDWRADKDFVVRLFRNSILQYENYKKLVAEQTPNWEADRISSIDMNIMVMAIAELLAFPEIPPKVTMNEYIELAKEYGTPKSKLFVNGVLDNIFTQLRKEGKIQKSGRGLVE